MGFKMKVIKQGTPPEEKVWKSYCHYCNSILEAKVSELAVTRDPRDGTEIGVGTCPVCKLAAHFYPMPTSQNYWKDR
jgi:hypothetical protein